MKYFGLTVALLAFCPALFANTQKNTLDVEYLQLAQTLKNEGNIDKAITYYQKATELNSENFVAFFDLANALFGKEKYELALQNYQKVTALKPDSASAHYNVGMTYQRLHQDDKALISFEKTIETNPNHVKAYQQVVQLLTQKNKFKEALPYAKKALEFEPNNFETVFKTGQIYKNLEDLDTAITYCRKAVELSPQNIHAILDLANNLNMLEQTDEALVLYQRILDINPSVQEALYNYGFTLKKQGHLHQAMEIYKKLIELKPNYSQPHFSLSLAYLTLGDFKSGWKEYEWRWAAYNEKPREYKQPMWHGEDIAGKTILLYAEQGLGDTLQFIRYAQLIKERGGRVIFDTQKPLKTFLSLVPYIDKVITGNDPLPNFDYHCALMSLPLIFDTTLETVPAQIPYLTADPKLVSQWQQKLSGDKNFKIGICWQGNSQYSTQFLRRTVAAKSLHVSAFKPLTEIPGVSVYSLQKVNGTDQLNECSLNIKTFGEDFDESHGRFMDTAAVIKNLDLVITIDTSISHFAAGLGAPTWILLPQPADWRWMLSRTDTPWYPNARLFRQLKYGEWQSLIETIVTEVKKYISKIKPNIPQQPLSMMQQQNDLGDIADSLALLDIQKNQTQVPIVNKTLFDYTIKRYPELSLLNQQLIEVNHQLFILDKELKTVAQSAFNEEFVNLTRKIACAYELKQYLKKKISSLQEPKMNK